MDGRRISLAAVVLVVLLAAAFWLVFLEQTADHALTRVPLLDEAWYLRDGARLRAEGGLGHAPFVMSPGYTLLVSWLGGDPPGDDGVLAATPRALLTLQALCWFGCGLLPAWAVWRQGRFSGAGTQAALVAAGLSCLLVLMYAPAAVFARLVLLDLPLTFLIAVAVCVPVATSARPRWAWLVAALALGLAATLRAHVLVLALLGLPLAWRCLGGGRRAAWLALTALVALAPVLVIAGHNTRLVGRPTGPSLNAGVNLYLGLQPEAGGLFTSLRGFQQAPDPAGEAFLERQLRRPLEGPADADQAWRAEAWRRLREAPGQALVNWVRKLWLHLQGWEIAQVTPLGRWPATVPVLRLLPVPWSVLVCLGLGAAGLVLLRRRTDPSPPWHGAVAMTLAAVAVLVAVQSLFFVTSRYRLVLAPLLALLAGLGVLQGRREGPRSALRALALLTILVLLTRPWGLGTAQARWQGLEAQNLASRLLVLADHDGADPLREQALPLLVDACAAVPRQAGPWADRARTLDRLGRADEALRVLSDGITQADDPSSLEWLRMGLLRDAGRLDQAEALMESYLQDHPDHVDMLHDLAVLQGQRGRWAAAEATSRRLRQVAPADARGWLDLAVAQARQGRRDLAMETLSEGLDAVSSADGRQLLEVNRARLGASGDGR